ncbi:unnamed protein product [Closterium sp. NIES-53]
MSCNVILHPTTTASPPVAASGRVAASGQVFSAASRSSPASAPCSYRPLSHKPLIWHHRLGHPSLPRLQGMASCTLVSGLPWSLPPLLPGPAPTCVPCVEGRQRIAPHSSEFPSTEAPLQTLHMDVWGPARVRGQDYERYFLLVVDDYSRCTTVFPLRSKGKVTDALAPRAAASMPWFDGTLSVRKLGAPGISQATEAALRSVWQPARLPTTSASARNVSAGTNTPRPPTPSVPLTKLLGRRGLTGMQLLLALATTKASKLHSCTSTSTTAAATSTTSAAASTAAAAASTNLTAATEASTPATTPTSTANPSTSYTASTAAPTVPSTTLAPLALAGAAPPTRRRRSPDLLSANQVDSSSRSNRGEKGDRGIPLKERGATVAARSTYS